jgi:hypothetical protein
MNDDRNRSGDAAELHEADRGVDSEFRASSELEKLRATASSLSELSAGLNEMVETLSRIIAGDDVPVED